MAGNFTIGGSSPSNFLYWRHRVVPGRSGRGVRYAFAGDDSWYLIQGVARPGDILVFGKLEASSLAALAAQLDALAAYQGDGQAHTIRLAASSDHGGDIEFDNCACVDVRHAADHRPERDETGTYLRRAVVTVWARLQNGGVS